MRHRLLICLFASLSFGASHANETPPSEQVQSIIANGKGMQEIPDAICYVDNLRKLDISANNIIKIPYCIGFHAMTLSDLDLSSNQITDIDPLVDVKMLRKLNLKDNQLNHLPTNIGNLTQLVELNLSNNALKTLPLNMAQLVYLHHLDLSDNQLTEVPKFLPYLVNLKTINLAGNPDLKSYISLVRQLMPSVDVNY